MSDANVKGQAPADHPPELERYLTPEAPRAQMIERGQAYLNDVGQWLREANVRLRGRQAIVRFTRAYDLLIQAAHAHVIHAWKQENPKKKAPDIAVVALGGYGRGEQFLRSDVDLLLLLEARNTAEDLALVKSLLHLLIDMRLNLGYSTRTVADCENVLGIDLESSTSMIETRFLAGNRGLYQLFEEQVGQGLTGRWRRWFIKAVYQEWLARRAKFESTVHLLEPNLKEGPGGLRDVHTVQWILFALTGSSDLKGLKNEGRFDDADLRRYRDAIAMIQMLRNEVHVASGGKNDQLLFHLQTAVAERLGYKADAHRSPEEVFMADYYRHARDIERYSTRAIRAMVHREKGVLGELFGTLRRKRVDGALLVQDGVLFPEGNAFEYFQADERRIMALFERAARSGWRISEETLEDLARVVPALGPGYRLDPANHERFLKILKNPAHVHQPIADMHACGLLGKYLPEFEHITCMVRIDYYHHYTVDEHTIKTLEMVQRLVNEPAGDERSFAAQIAAQIKRWDLLCLALILHDIGKGFGRGHALRGGQVAQRVGERLGLSRADIDTVRFLVLSHLKLSHASQRRDLADPEVARQLANEIGSLERLKLLYVHSVCDLMAVSPEAWTEWKDRLLAECYVAVAALLGEGTAKSRLPQPNIQVLTQKVLAAIADEVRESRSDLKITPELERELAEFLKNAADRYVQTCSPPIIARHFLMKRGLGEKNVLDWRLELDTGTGFSELTVAALDVPGLFSNICGALAAKGINIWSAQIFSTNDGYALNTFQVTDLENKPLPAGLRLERLHHDLNQVILGEKTIEALIEKHRGRVRRKPRVRPPVPSVVLIDNNTSAESTILEIRTADRPGLLYLITRTLSECQLNIQRSIITTAAYGVADVFYVTDLEYNKIHDPVQRKQIEETLLAAIDGADPAPEGQ